VPTTARSEPGSGWELAPAPAADECRTWSLERPAQLAVARRDARHLLAVHPTESSDEASELVILVLDELASNALRHGVPPATVELCEHADGWLVIATDAAPEALPLPALNRPEELGGMGLHMIAKVTLRCGTDVDDDKKCVWALLAH
jgi:hypothetical protein